MLIYLDPRFTQVEEECRSYPLPTIKLYDSRDAEARYEPGYDTMREMVTRRLASLNLTAGHIFAPQVLDLLIHKSGGVTRWFIQLVQAAGRKAELRGLDRIDREAATVAVEDRVADLTG